MRAAIGVALVGFACLVLGACAADTTGVNVGIAYARSSWRFVQTFFACQSKHVFLRLVGSSDFTLVQVHTCSIDKFRSGIAELYDEREVRGAWLLRCDGGACVRTVEVRDPASQLTSGAFIEVARVHATLQAKPSAMAEEPRPRPHLSATERFEFSTANLARLMRRWEFLRSDVDEASSTMIRFMFADPLTAAQTDDEGHPAPKSQASSTVASVSVLVAPRSSIFSGFGSPSRVTLLFAASFGKFLSPESDDCTRAAATWTAAEQTIAVANADACVYTLQIANQFDDKSLSWRNAEGYLRFHFEEFIFETVAFHKFFAEAHLRWQRIAERSAAEL